MFFNMKYIIMPFSFRKIRTAKIVNIFISCFSSMCCNFALSRAGALGYWLAPLPFTLEFGARFGGLKTQKCFFSIHSYSSFYENGTSLYLMIASMPISYAPKITFKKMALTCVFFFFFLELYYAGQK